MHIKNANEKTYKLEIKFTLEISKSLILGWQLTPLTFGQFRDQMIDLLYNYRYNFNKNNLTVRVDGNHIIGGEGEILPLDINRM